MAPLPSQGVDVAGRSRALPAFYGLGRRNKASKKTGPQPQQPLSTYQPLLSSRVVAPQTEQTESQSPAPSPPQPQQQQQQYQQQQPLPFPANQSDLAKHFKNIG